MENVIIFGHKNPDTDSITASLAMEYLEKQLGNDVEACRLGDINKETEFVLNHANVEAPKLIDDIEEGQDVIMVDHSNVNESIENIENANILKIIDHHMVGITTSYPVYYRAEPVGCTGTIIVKLYKEEDIEIPKDIAILLLSAIISDTLLFKSPTCTEKDVKTAEELAEIADIDIEEYGMEMLKAGTDLSSFTVEEIIDLDAKKIDLKDKKSIIAQVNTASIPDVLEMKNELIEAMEKSIEENSLDLFMLVITDIVESTSVAIVLGEHSSIAERAYEKEIIDDLIELEGVVSRKKQIVPIMTDNA